jgi:hypothetical protein
VWGGCWVCVGLRTSWTEMDIGTRLHCMCFLAWSCTSPRAGDSTIYYLRDNKQTKRHAHLYFPAVDPKYMFCRTGSTYIFGFARAEAEI